MKELITILAVNIYILLLAFIRNNFYFLNYLRFGANRLLLSLTIEGVYFYEIKPIFCLTFFFILAIFTFQSTQCLFYLLLGLLVLYFRYGAYQSIFFLFHLFIIL